MLKIGVVLVLVTVTKHGLAQRYHHPYHHPNVWSNPAYRQYSYQFMPSVPTAGRPGLFSGSRIVGAVKSNPVHSSTILGGSPQYTSSSSPYLSTAASHPVVNYYSGHNYKSQSQQSPYSVSSPVYSSSPYYQSSRPTTVTTATSPSSQSSSLFNLFGRPSSPSSVASYSQAQFLPTRIPSGPMSGSSMETYKEALDLFSEVVHKLEKDTGGNGFRSNYMQSSPVLNGIYGSSGMGLPHHLDHLMGPDFLQRAHKLYNKIIKEQSYNRIAPSEYFPNSASRGHASNGLSYYEGAIQPDSRPSTYNFPRASPYARNMALDRVDPADSTLERSLVDTVRSIEMGMAKDKRMQTLTEDMMETAESRMVPRDANLASAINKHILNQIIGNSPTPLSALPSPILTQLAAEQPSTLFSSIPSTTPPLPTSIVPLNKNDFIEHPLPFNDYAQLIQDIATNHNY